MSEKVKSAPIRACRRSCGSFLQVLRGELGRLTVEAVAEDGAAGRPREHHANEVPPEEMAKLARREHGVLERIVVPVDEQHHFLAPRSAETALDLSFESLLRSCMRG